MSTMPKAQEYRNRAEECIRQAEGCSTETDKNQAYHGRRMAQDGATGGAAHRPSLNFVRREPHDETCAHPQPCSLTIRCLSCLADGFLLIFGFDHMRRCGNVTIAGYDVRFDRLASLGSPTLSGGGRS
jgi:hypothetical protein